MKPKWLKLAAEMLEAYSERLGNDGCNDWRWPKDWTHAERLEFCIRSEEDNVRRELTAEEIADAKHTASREWGPNNSSVAGFLASELLAESEDV